MVYWSGVCYLISCLVVRCEFSRLPHVLAFCSLLMINDIANDWSRKAMEEEMAQVQEGEEQGGTNLSGSNPFPPPAAGNDNPECQQS